MTTTTLNSGQSTPPPRQALFSSKQGQESLAGVSFVTPALIVIGLFVFIPVIFALVISFTDWTGNRPPSEAKWVGLTNYKDLLVNGETIEENFFTAVKNTAYYVIGVVPTQTVLSLLLAFVVNQKFLKGRGLFRTAFYFPSITSSVVIGTVFLWLFNRDGLINRAILAVSGIFGGGYKPLTWLGDLHGLFHNFLHLFGVTISNAPDWLTQTQVGGLSLWDWISGPSVAMFAIMLLAIWTTSGTLMLIFLAALQDIPGQLYEAASVDGATKWQQFRKITLPLLRPTTFFVVTIGLIGTFQVFDQIFVISKGEPGGTTSTIAWVVYRNAFSSDAAAGRGSATAIILFALILIFTVLQRRLAGSTKNT